MPFDIEGLRLLLVEDSDDDAELVLEALSSSGFDVAFRRVENAAGMIEALEKSSWDAVLSDFNLPEFSTQEALDILKSYDLDLPFIVVSGYIGEEAAVAMMKSGAHDFVMKGNLARLGPALARELREAELRRERKAMEADLKRWADIFRHAHWGVAIQSPDGQIFEGMNPEFARMYGYEVEELRGAAISDFFPGDCCQIPCGCSDLNVWEAEHVRKDGSVFPVLINVTEVMGDAGGAAYRVVNVQDITRLKETENALAKSEARFSAMTNNVPGMVFQYFRVGERGRFSFVSEGAHAVCGLPAEEILADQDAFFALFHESDSLLETMRESARKLSSLNWEGLLFSCGGQEKWVNLRATPRRLEDGSLLWDGVLFNITESKQKEDEIRRSRELLRQLSAHRDSAREEERKRIAREIHDELGQALTALKIDVDWLAERLADEGKIGDRLKSMSNILLETVSSVRRIAEHLRPGMLDDLGLAAAIEWQVDQFMARSGIRCGLSMNKEEFELDERLAICIYRIIQEALTNVARHSGADSVEVRIKEEDEKITLEVSDNGVGFDTESKRHSYGLLGIRERVEMIGGKVEVSSRKGRGTTLKAMVPIEGLQ